MVLHEHTDKEIKKYLKNIFRFSPRHIEPYKIALTHSSVSQRDAVCGKLNNERLEYLGDAILGAVVADFLYHKYPLESEGVLTRMRSKLVNRARLNALAHKIGLHDMMLIHEHSGGNSADGNAFEALAGAIYLDQGYKKTYNILIHNIFLVHLNMDEVYEQDDDYKSQILIWAQRKKQKVAFSSEPTSDRRGHLYKTTLSINGQVMAEGLGTSVKKSEQSAAEKALASIRSKTEE